MEFEFVDVHSFGCELPENDRNESILTQSRRPLAPSLPASNGNALSNPFHFELSEENWRNDYFQPAVDPASKAPIEELRFLLAITSGRVWNGWRSRCPSRAFRRRRDKSPACS